MTFDYARIPDDIRQKLRDFATIAYSTVQGVEHTYLAARDIVARGVSGVFVECGVANGAQVCAMLEATDTGRDFHLFDSFCGIPMAGPNDHDQPGIGTHVVDQNLPLRDRLVSSGVSAASVLNVKHNLRRFGFNADMCSYHEGWFQDTVPTAAVGPIAMLRLDGDLYESTEVCMRWLYPRIVRGGCLLVDDYPLPGCRKAVDDYFSANSISAQAVIACDTGAAYFRIE